jgi:hypothetical protein
MRGVVRGGWLTPDDIDSLEVLEDSPGDFSFSFTDENLMPTDGPFWTSTPAD